jgi:arylsulfatase A-like enzyme/cytochrome c-type biogenesis protein CcmH/NrfG
MKFFQQFLLIMVVLQCAVPATGPASQMTKTTPSGEREAKTAADAPSRRAKLPNIILITLDTTRADRMGFLGSKRGLTPNLDALAQESAVFTHAYAQVPLTTPSHATILSGTYPQFHGLISFPMALPKDVPYGPEILHAQGYRTGAFVGSMAMAPGTLAPGFERGFDTYDADFHPENLGKKKYHKKERYHTLERPGDEVTALALAWLNQQPQTPFFLLVHLYDAHAPYEPPEPYQSRYASEPYDGGIAYEDAVVGRFLQELKGRKLYDGAVIAVMADHGESLGAHGEQEHGVFLYDETIHVPLIVKLPHGTGKRIESRVELADVMPTLLESVEMTVPSAMQGASLLGLINGDNGAIGAWRDRPAYAQTDYARLSFSWSALQSWRTGKYLYVDAPRRELYDETADPATEHNLASSSPAVADTLAAKMESFREKRSSHRPLIEVIVTPEAQKNLAALGYATSENSRSKASDRGPDPKDRIESLRLMEQLRPILEDARYEEAVPLLHEVIAKEPNMSAIYVKLAGSYMNLRQYKKAIPVMRKALEMSPGDIDVEMNLGLALLETQDFSGAATVFEGVVAKSPESLIVHNSLEIAYFGSNRFSDAIKECEHVLAVSPEDYNSYVFLGLSLARTGELEAAVPKLQKAAALRPEAPKPHMFLATVYSKLGRDADAERERAEGIRLRAKPPASPDVGSGDAKQE